MPDVLENLTKLPPRCVGEIGGRKVLIQRGVMGYVETELTPRLYEHIPVSPAQRQAMQVGCVLGWDKAGANPDTYEQTNNGEPIVQKKYEFVVPFIMGCEFVHEAYGMAEGEAEALAKEIQEAVQQLVADNPAITSFSIDDQLQLVYETEIDDESETSS